MSTTTQKLVPSFLAASTIFFAGCGTSHPERSRSEPGFRANVVWDGPSTLSEKQNAVWLGYAIARAVYIRKHEDQYPGIRISGISAPQFAEEVDARSHAARIYREMAAKDKTFRDAYFEDLLAVETAGFVPEYVWTYLHQPAWPETQKPAKLAEFDSWRQTHLTAHRVRTYGRISISSK